MKAIVMFAQDALPEFTAHFPEPVAKNENELLMSVKAAAIKHLDRSMASGQHYSTAKDLHHAKVIGGDGVGILADGTRVYALGLSGMMAEKAIIEKSRMVPLPDGIDNATAAALPNAVAGSAMALRFRANIKAGETVLINGATGFTGRIAIQVARHYGARKIIATGRNEQSLQSLKELGADELILTTDEEHFTAQVKKIHGHTPIDIVIDYLWGHTAELLLAAFKGQGSFTHQVRFISVGSITGDTIHLSAAILRSVAIQLSGSGLGSWTANEMKTLFSDIIPEMFQLVAANKLKVATEQVAISDMEQLWAVARPDGKRMVVVI